MDRKSNVLLIWPERDKAFYDIDPIGEIFGNKSIFLPLPLLYVAAALGDEWNYILVDEAVTPLNDKDIKQADYYMISVNILQRFSAEKTLQRLLPQKKPIIIGGPLISTLDHIFHYPLVSKVFGEIECREASQLESEMSIGELLSHDMKNGTLKPEYHAKGHPDIRKNKVPRYDLVKHTGYMNLTMQTSRGCPHHCDFCQQVALYGKHQRKNVAQVIQELNLLLRLGQNKTIYITDDNVMGDLNSPDKKIEYINLLNSILEWQEAHDFPFDFFTQCSLDVADHEDIVALMAKTGLNIMFIGIESVDDATLTSIHKNQNLKKDMVSKIRLLQGYGIGIFAGLIIGFDNDTEASVQKQIDFVKKSGIPIVGISVMMGFPKTRLFKNMENDRRISSDADALTRPFWTNIIPAMHPATLYRYFQLFTKEIYNPKEYFARCLTWTETWNDSYVIPGKKGSLPENVKLLRMARSLFYQGILASYRIEFFKYVLMAVVRFRKNYNRLALALYLGYLFKIAHNTTKNIDRFVCHLPKQIINDWENRFNDGRPA